MTSAVAKLGRLFVVAGLALQLAGAAKQRRTNAAPAHIAPPRPDPLDDYNPRELVTLDGRLSFHFIAQLAACFGTHRRERWQ